MSSDALLRLNVDLADNAIDPERVVWLACDMLVAGIDSPALRELAGESPTRLEKRDADALVEQVLLELGITPMSYEDADWFLGREAALQVVAGVPRAEWDDATWRITQRVNDEEDGVYWALARYDTDPEPFLGYVREYLRLAEERLTAS
ncbi:hypothetical protein GCM10011609_53530 [Lentzea pudingi]|uniref:Uncharacterized protein n=1 Tax=Lentzea pudingi TaxID=1789439 RepID=A0ABQ2IEB5_9PSEU|nr:hypothetical protein [Lentzea pudingi]GGN07314.1 hypothetical protein GCM10011609_53530 [Lentzea pudingi]